MGILILTSGKVIVIVSIGVAYLLCLKRYVYFLGKSTPFSFFLQPSFPLFTTPLNFTLTGRLSRKYYTIFKLWISSVYQKSNISEAAKVLGIPRTVIQAILSPAPLHSPYKTPAEIEDRVVEAKTRPLQGLKDYRFSYKSPKRESSQI